MASAQTAQRETRYFDSYSALFTFQGDLCVCVGMLPAITLPPDAGEKTIVDFVVSHPHGEAAVERVQGLGHSSD